MLKKTKEKKKRDTIATEEKRILGLTDAACIRNEPQLSQQTAGAHAKTSRLSRWHEKQDLEAAKK